MSVGSSSMPTRLFGAAMIAGPVLLLIASVFYAAGEDQTGGTIQIYASAAWILILFGLTRLIEAPLPRATAVVLVVGALGITGAIAYGLDVIHVAEGAISVEEAGAYGGFALFIPGALFPLANLGLGIALYRAGVEPRWAGIALAVAAILFPLSRIPDVEALMIVCDAIFIAALAPLGWSILQGERIHPTANTGTAAAR